MVERPSSYKRQRYQRATATKLSCTLYLQRVPGACCNQSWCAIRAGMAGAIRAEMRPRSLRESDYPWKLSHAFPAGGWPCRSHATKLPPAGSTVCRRHCVSRTRSRTNQKFCSPSRRYRRPPADVRAALPLSPDPFPLYWPRRLWVSATAGCTATSLRRAKEELG